MIEIRCPAKINLYLRVVGVLPGGYHALETLFQEIDLADRLSWARDAGPVSLEIEGAELGPFEDNLVWRAILGFAKASGQPVTGRFRLVKQIPAGAGLGGGSSDAAAALRLLQAGYGYPLDPAQLAGLALSLGSDVPFFLEGGCQLGRGRGEQLCPAEPPTELRRGFLILPGMALATADVFRAYARGARPAQAARAQLGENDLLEAALQVSAPFARFWNLLAAQRLAGHLFMTGSGSSCVYLGPETVLPDPYVGLLAELGARAVPFRFAGPI